MTNIIAFIISLFIASLLPGAQPNLQTSKAADTARANDVQRLSSAVLVYESNARGKLPTASELSTADLDEITTVVDEGQPTTSQAVYTAGKNCDGEASSRAYSVTIMLASGKPYCSGS